MDYERAAYILRITTRVYAPRLDVPARLHSSHRFPFSVSFLPVHHRQKNVSQGVMRRRPSLDILPSFFRSFPVTSAKASGLPARKRGRTAESFRHNIFYRWEPYIITMSDEKRASLSASNRPSRWGPFIPDSTGFYHEPPLCACLRLLFGCTFLR